MARTLLFKQVMRLLNSAARGEEPRPDDSRLYSRREVLRMAAHAGALLPLAGLPSLARATGHDPVVIVGAGIAGLVAAYRLQEAGVPVELYEGGRRLGGRVFTKDRFNEDGMFCELGGELIDSDHRDVLALCRELGVPVQDLRPFDAGVEADLFHFGGKVRTGKEMYAAFRPLAAHLARDIEAIYPDGNVRMPTWDRPGPKPEIARKFDHLTLRQYLRSKTDVDRWVLDAIETLYVCEYGMDAAEQSALNLLILIDPKQPPEKFNLLGSSDECLRVQGGNSRLAEALESRVRRHQPRIQLGHKLARIEHTGSRIGLTFDTDEGRRTVRASRAILAIPFTTLRKVEGVSELGLNPRKARCIAELGYGMNTKFMVGFRDRLWRHPSAGTPASRMNLVTEAVDQSYWETSKGQTGTRGILTNFLGGSRALDKRTPPERLPTVLAELDAIYPGMKAAHDGNTALFDWGHSPLALGSYVSPRPGQYTTLWGSAHTPELGGKLFFAGEHTSVEGAGFINGAVESGNRVAGQILKKTGRLPSEARPVVFESA